MPAPIRVLRCRLERPIPLARLLNVGANYRMVGPGDLLWLEGREKPVLVGEINVLGYLADANRAGCNNGLMVTHIACIDLDALEVVHDLKSTRR